MKDPKPNGEVIKHSEARVPEHGFTILDFTKLYCSWCAKIGPPVWNSGYDQAGGWVSGWVHPTEENGKWAKCACQEAWQLNVRDQRRCAVCGGIMVHIRGRVPGDPVRLACPTCAVERLEHIHDLASRDYGEAAEMKSMPLIALHHSKS